MQETVQVLLVAVNERIELMGQGKDHMEVRCVNDFCPAFIHPDLLENSLTVRAVTVTAGVVMEFHVSAVHTPAHIDPKFSGFTVQDGTGRKVSGFLELSYVITELIPGNIFRVFVKELRKIIQISPYVGTVACEGMVSETAQGDHLPERMQIFVHRKNSFEM